MKTKAFYPILLVLVILVLGILACGQSNPGVNPTSEPTIASTAAPAEAPKPTATLSPDQLAQAWMEEVYRQALDQNTDPNLDEFFKTSYNTMDEDIVLAGGEVVPNYGGYLDLTTPPADNRLEGSMNFRDMKLEEIQACYPTQDQVLYLPYPFFTQEEKATYGEYIELRFATDSPVYSAVSPVVSITGVDGADPESHKKIRQYQSTMLLKEVVNWGLMREYMLYASEVISETGETYLIECALPDGTVIQREGLSQGMVSLIIANGRFMSATDVAPSVITVGNQNQEVRDLIVGSNPQLEEVIGTTADLEFPSERKEIFLFAVDWTVNHWNLASNFHHVGDFNSLP